MHKAWSSIEEMPYCFSRSYVKLQGHTALKIVEFDPNWAFPDSKLQLEFTDGYEMMHRAWSSIVEVPYCFSRSSIKYQGHTGWKINDLNSIWVRLQGRSQLSNPSDLPCSMSSVQFCGHGRQQNASFDPIWAFADCKSKSNALMAMKLCTKQKGAWKRSLLFFKAIGPISRSHRPNKGSRPVTAIKSLRFAFFKQGKSEGFDSCDRPSLLT